ncbi:hypothetical protein [Pontiella sulfatireligans]|uniref:SLA1 homology domain-containing protein n=1 Tax=Pontiella sulfatireligans TaxID=2750658 RepID=A0A6C2UPA8_9BACT|nr:hypothetical protein [Pontiella sulfatireligans]VGO21101.1 hypothetical protein SCARR_03170 [Pontiella sulfatireligans]
MCRFGLWVVLAVLSAAPWNVWGEGDLHIFTDLQDRVVSARIVRMDEMRGMLELELENKRRVKVKPSVFTEEDQAYIHEWCVCQAFLMSTGLRFSGEKKVIEDWSESGGVGINREFEKVVYTCELKNGSPTVFENVEVEYCVYWVQEIPQVNGEKRIEADYSGRYEIAQLEPRACANFQTDPVTLVYQYLQGGYSYRDGAPGKQSSKMKGVWLKVSMMTPSGKKVIREFCEPSDVMKRQVWKERVPDVVASVDGKKKKSRKKKQGKKKKNQ